LEPSGMETEMTHDFVEAFVAILICVALVLLAIGGMRLERKVKNLERQLKDFDVIPQTFDSSRSS
jgi:hypothetical protein